MNAGGVLGSMCFPSFPGFSGRLFAAADDKDLALAVVRAYNDWHIDEWCGAYPGRFIPMAPARCCGTPSSRADEVRRLADEGLPLDHLHREPRHARLPELPRATTGTRFWKALCDDRTSCCRSTSARRASSPSPRPTRPIDVMITLQPMNICAAAADLLWSRVLKEFPDLQHRPVRGRHRLDPLLPRPRSTAPTTCTTCGPARTSATSCPSDVFREHFLTCFITDPIGVKLRHDIGIDNIAGSATTRTPTRRGPTPPEELGARRRRRARRRHQQDRPTRTPCAGTPSTRSPTGRRRTARSPPCAPRPPATTWRSGPSTGPLRAQQGHRPRQAGRQGHRVSSTIRLGAPGPRVPMSGDEYGPRRRERPVHHPRPVPGRQPLGGRPSLVVHTPNLDASRPTGCASAGTTARPRPVRPGRASLYTGIYQMNHRVVTNGTPLDDRFDNVAHAGRRAGYRPTLFGYTDQAIDPRRATGPDDPRLSDLRGGPPRVRRRAGPAGGHDAVGRLAAGPRPRDHRLDRPDARRRVDRPAEHSVAAFLTERVDRLARS